jgi:glycosyltransferase involved in cell wall biosynthesis
MIVGAPCLAPSKALSVGIVSPSLSHAAGGILPIMQGHARGMQAKGVIVAAYGIAKTMPAEHDPGWHGIPCHVYPPVIGRLGYCPALGTALDESQHDILHQHGLWLHPSSLVRAWADQTGKPVMISTQGMLEPWAVRNSRLKKRIASLLFEHRNLGAANCLHASAVEVTGIRALGYRNPIAVIPNGIDLPDPVRQHPRPSFLSRDDRKILLFLGRIHPKKGVQQTLEAWARAVADRPQLRKEWVVVMAGWDNGGHLAREIRRARDLGLEADVAFPGAVFGLEKDALLQHAAAFILASYSEGLPMAVLEAWAHETPVFMTQGCNLPEGFREAAAFEISVDPADIARKLVEHLPDPRLGETGKAGRRLVETRFTWDQVTGDLVEVYRWLVSGGPPPSSIDFAERENARLTT